MAKKFITKEMNHFRLHGAVRSILRNTVAKLSTRYALECVLVAKDKLVATDGRKLVIVEKTHKIKPGLYYITQDGFMLPDAVEGNFPKYQDILLKDAKAENIAEHDTSEMSFSIIVCHLNRLDIIFDLFALQESLMTSLRFASGDGYVLETKGPDSPFQLSFPIQLSSGQYRVATDTAKILYVQMPAHEKKLDR